jgi:predicted nucleic acid-binding protein
VNGFVCIDACVAVKWVMPEEDSHLAVALYTRLADDNDAIIAPPHMTVEVMNAIWRRANRGDLTFANAEEAIARFMDFPISLAAPTGLYESAVQLARRFNRPTVYDTHYVALAEIAECEMWTADKRLLNSLGGRLDYVRDLADFPST